MAAGGNQVASAFILHMCISLGCILAFSIIRQTRLYRKFVQPKRFDKAQLIKPRRPSPSFFGWIPAVWQYTEHEIIEVAGLDTAVYLRIVQFGVESFFYISVWCLIAVLPVNLSGTEINSLLAKQSYPSPPPSPPLPPPNPVPPSPPNDFPPAPECQYEAPVQTKDYQFTTFDKCSISNLPPGSKLFWVHVVTIYFITIVILKLVERYNKEIVLLRNIFISKSAKGGPSHTVLVSDVPGVFYGTVGETLQSIAEGTLFRFFPERLRKRILDKIGQYANVAIEKGSKISIGNALDKTRKGDDDDEPGEGEVNPDDVELQELPSVAVRTPFGATASFVEKRKVITYADMNSETLDPWKQAQSVLKQGKTVHELIQLEFELVYGVHALAAINVVHDQRTLEGLVAKYHKTRTLLEDYLDQCASYVRRRKQVKRKIISVIPPLEGKWAIEKYGVRPVKLDAILFWSEALSHQVAAVEAEQVKALESEIPTAFVTFNHRQNQCIAANSLMHHDETAWRVQNAPEHFEIIWKNVKMRTWERSLRTLLFWSLFTLMTLFYLIPISFIQLMIEAPNKWTGAFWDNGFVKFLLQAILPGLVLKIFLAILPMILALMCLLSGYISESAIDFGVVFRYFIFQVVAVFFGNMIVGSFTNQLSQFVNDPSSFFKVLGVAIPKTATFFITYIMISNWTAKSLAFLRIPNLIIYSLLSRFAATPRAKARLWADQFTTYGKTVVDQTIVILLGLVYSAINPIMCPTVWISFILNTLYERYLNIYVWKRQYESGGLLWSYVFLHVMVSLYIMQIGFFALMIIKRFTGAPALLPVIAFTICFHIAYLQLYSRPWSVLSLHDTAELDCMDRDLAESSQLTAEELEDIRTKYLSPVFKITHEDIEDLLLESKIMDRRLNGEKIEDIKEALEYEAYMSASEGEDEDIKDVGEAADAVPKRVHIDIEAAVHNIGLDIPSTSNGIRPRDSQCSAQTSAAPSQIKMMLSTVKRSDE